MERILNEEEKIRRAEEIYNRRNNKNETFISKKESLKKRYLGSRIGFQILILLNLAITLFCIQNKENIFKEEFLNILASYEEKINCKINNLINYEKEEIINSTEITDNIEENKENILIENNIEEDILNENKTDQIENIVPNTEIVSSMSQMDIDVENLKKTYNFFKPIENGIISSKFGARESEYQNVKGYHTGTDIAAEKGTKIKSSFNGIVSLVSNEGDYGKHIKVRCNNVITLYAHCSKILVKEGEFVSEGQEIAEVGSTGNSTGPHLHFEIRVDDRFVDPEKLISF